MLGLGRGFCESGSFDRLAEPGYIAGYAKRAVKNPIPRSIDTLIAINTTRKTQELKYIWANAKR